MNIAILIGRTTRDVETNQSGKVGWTSIAVDRSMRDQDGNRVTDYIDIRFLGEKQTTNAKQLIPKGTKIVVTGENWTDSYTNRDGQKVNMKFVKVNSWEFAESKKSATQQVPSASDPYMQSAPQNNSVPNGFTNVPVGNNDYLPFN